MTNDSDYVENSLNNRENSLSNEIIVHPVVIFVETNKMHYF